MTIREQIQQFIVKCMVDGKILSTTNQILDLIEKEDCTCQCSGCKDCSRNQP